MTPSYRHTLKVALIIGLSCAAQLRAAAIPEEVVNRAVDRGLAALKKMQAANGSFCGTTHGSGPTSLAALAMLECDVAPADEQITKALAVVRADCPAVNHTYNLALAILLLDRVGDPLDEPIIHVLTVRLLEGQAPIGGWGYTTPDVPGDESKKLRTMIEQRAELKTAPGPTPTDRPPLAPEIIDRLRRIEQRRTPSPDAGGAVDNSNTQFALLGLWVGRRHGIPTDAALKRAEAYFRATQEGGRWPYRPREQIIELPANTCSGLLGLAIGAGIVRETQLRTNPERKDGKPVALRDPLKDPLVQAAMNYVGRQTAELAVTGLNNDTNVHRHLYFLWSVERVGMIYSVAAMGGVDWYRVGATAILRAQEADGSWAASRSILIPSITPDISTSFALLFLRKSNFVHDLTNNLKIKPKQTTLRSGDEKAEAVPEPTVEPTVAPTETERLARDLPGAAPARQEAIIVELRDGKGTDFTEALAQAIPKLAGAIQKKARDALAERLARMTAATIRTKLKDGDAEVRRAATLACAMKEDKAFIPDLIAVLDDKDNWVIRAAAVALHALAGQDFGPSANATPEERAKAVAAWKAWWKRQTGG